MVENEVIEDHSVSYTSVTCQGYRLFFVMGAMQSSSLSSCEVYHTVSLATATVQGIQPPGHLYLRVSSLS